MGQGEIRQVLMKRDAAWDETREHGKGQHVSHDRRRLKGGDLLSVLWAGGVQKWDGGTDVGGKVGH